MVNKPIKIIGLICLWLASLSLVGCFHIPDEDWLPNKNKAGNGNIQRNNEVEDAFNSFIDGVGMISTQRNEIKDNESVEISQEEALINTRDINIDDENLNQEIIIEE